MYTPYRYRPDVAVRYGPRYDIKHYTDEMEWTEGALVDFFDQKNRKTIKEVEVFITYSKPLVTALFALIGFNLHKFPLIQRIEPYKWPMFVLKFAVFFGGTLGYYNFIEKNFRSTFGELVYAEMSGKYKLYKRSGDIRFLNPEIRMEELPFE